MAARKSEWLTLVMEPGDFAALNAFARALGKKRGTVARELILRGVYGAVGAAPAQRVSARRQQP